MGDGLVPLLGVRDAEVEIGFEEIRMRDQHLFVLDDRHVGVAAGQVHGAQIGAHAGIVGLAAQVMLVGGDRLVVVAAVVVDIAHAAQRRKIFWVEFQHMSVSVGGLGVIRRVEHRGALGGVAVTVPRGDVLGRSVGLGLQLVDELTRLVRDFDHFRMTGRQVPGRAGLRRCDGGERERDGCWRMMRAAAPRPITKMSAKTAANAGVKCDGTVRSPDAGSSDAGSSGARIRSLPEPADTPDDGVCRERGGRRHRRSATDAEFRAGHHRRSALRTKAHLTLVVPDYYCPALAPGPSPCAPLRGRRGRDRDPTYREAAGTHEKITAAPASATAPRGATGARGRRLHAGAPQESELAVYSKPAMV